MALASRFSLDRRPRRTTIRCHRDNGRRHVDDTVDELLAGGAHADRRTVDGPAGRHDRDAGETNAVLVDVRTATADVLEMDR